MNDPIIFILIAPGGSGKTSICHESLRRLKNMMYSISTTTRKNREGERDGIDYFFVNNEEFENRIRNNRFLEHAEFNGKKYGTELTNIEIARENALDLFLDIDVQGAEQIKSIYQGSVVTIFLIPPSFEEMKKRLTARGSETASSIHQRLEIAKYEIERATEPNFSDYFLINEIFDDSVNKVCSIVTAERIKFKRAYRIIS